ncbi:zf-TFIIB domain-containing protein [Actinoplanes sp. NPDC051346]|uniref:TFIIB-type zinc ribbon-containing protein n=1 Tax=Actinoplanes sp. NPDC051346 TaxID=3155048 RepID=UPI003417ACD7
MQMTCPKCHGEMRTYERSGVTIDQCTECRGIFLDRGELEKLFEAEANWNNRQAPAGAPPRPAQAPGAPAPGGYAPPPPPPAPGGGYAAPPPAPPGYGQPAYPPAAAAYGAPQYGRPGHHGHYRQGHGHHGHYRRKKSFLNELFD